MKSDIMKCVCYEKFNVCLLKQENGFPPHEIKDKLLKLLAAFNRKTMGKY